MIWYAPSGFAGTDQKRQSAAAHALLKRALSQSGIDGAVAREPNGKPVLAGRADLHISITHCEGLVACSIDEIPVGIDAEKIRPFNERIARRVCSEEELVGIERDIYPARMFFRLWVLKESYGKALGVGISYPMRKVSFRVTDNTVICSVSGCSFELFEGFEGYVVALCRITDGPVASKPLYERDLS